MITSFINFQELVLKGKFHKFCAEDDHMVCVGGRNKIDTHLIVSTRYVLYFYSILLPHGLFFFSFTIKMHATNEVVYDLFCTHENNVEMVLFV